jgi:putative pyoverdin transport system ATP-binding/permease protein
MSFFRLVRREMQGSLNRLVVMSGLGGISTASILAAINAGAQAADKGQLNIWPAALFVIALLLFINTQRYVLITATAEIEAIIHNLRLRLMEHVRRSELRAVEGIGRAEIVAAITRDTASLTQASNTLAFSAQGAVLIFFVAAYVLYLSVWAFALSVLIVGIAGVLFQARSRHLAAAQREAARWENRLYDRLQDMLDGFKEVRLNSARSDNLFEDIVEVSRAAANIKIRAQSETFLRMVFLQSSLYALLGTVVFAIPVLTDSLASSSITKTVTALVFVVGATFGLIQSIPIITAANTSADNIERLEAKLLAAAAAEPLHTDELPKRFGRIEVRDLMFRYVDKYSDTAFQIGPINFTLNAGDLVFITGGNGSGKSTFVRVLSGLYIPDSGTITCDGELVSDRNRQKYRELIAAVFPDFHLFQKLYGIPDPDPAEVDRLLAEFRLLDKTGLVDGEFRTIDLSSGQRKRLALIVSLLEKRPILLLDEWAADQDPEFRRKFYYDLLPALKRAGATVVAITHDDRYLDDVGVPTRKLRMDEGRFVGTDSVESAS